MSCIYPRVNFKREFSGWKDAMTADKALLLVYVSEGTSRRYWRELVGWGRTTLIVTICNHLETSWTNRWGGRGEFSLLAGVRHASYQPLNIRTATSIPLEFSGLQPQPNDAIDIFDSEPCEFELSHAIHILQSSTHKTLWGTLQPPQKAKPIVLVSLPLHTHPHAHTHKHTHLRAQERERERTQAMMI